VIAPELTTHATALSRRGSNAKPTFEPSTREYRSWSKRRSIASDRIKVFAQVVVGERINDQTTVHPASALGRGADAQQGSPIFMQTIEASDQVIVSARMAFAEARRMCKRFNTALAADWRAASMGLRILIESKNVEFGLRRRHQNRRGAHARIQYRPPSLRRAACLTPLMRESNGSPGSPYSPGERSARLPSNRQG